MAGRRWSKSESQYLKRRYWKDDVADIASHLGRSVGSVYQHAAKIGVSGRYDKAEIQCRDRQIRRLHNRGWSSGEMEAVVGIGCRTIRERLHKMGLTPNGRNDRYRRKVAKKTREQCKSAGVRNLGELRSQKISELASRRGWPDHLSLRAIQIVEILYHRGPMTRKQIAEAIGMKWRGSRKTLSNNRVPGGSYMAELQRAGLVVRLEKAITHKGKGNHQDLYMVALDVEPCQEVKRRRSQSRT